jgi:hypothetical protein
MGTGSIAGESVRIGPANLVWIEKISGDIMNLTNAGSFAWSKSPGIPGFKCDHCGVIELHLTKENIEAES